MKTKDRSDQSDGAAAPVKEKGRWRENIEALLIALVLALLIRTFVVQAFKIPSGSMLNTLQIGDHILVNKFIYGVKMPFVRSTVIPISNPDHGDIVVFKYPQEPDKDYIKRTVAIAGDTVVIRNKKLFVNGVRQKDPFVVFRDSRIMPRQLGPRDNFGPITVPADSIFVMGDNRDESFDSRFWGFVKLKAIKGKAFLIYWSWDSDDWSVRWRRLGNLLH